MPDLYIILLLLIILIISSGIIYLATKWFEIAVLSVILSPWIPALFYKNLPELEYVQETNMGSYLRLGFLVIAGVVGVMKYIQSWPVNKGRLTLHLSLLAIFIVVSLISISYSIDQNFTFIRSISFLVLGLFLLGLEDWLHEKKQFEKTINILCIFTIICIALNLIVLLIYPSRAWWWSEENRFIGLLDHPNSLGAFCMLSYFVLLWKINLTKSLFGKIFLFINILLTMAFHLLSGSRTSILAACVGLIIWFLIQRKFIISMIFTSFAILCIILILQFKPLGFLRLAGTEITDLAGREDFWKSSFVMVAERPLQGYGYGVDGMVWKVSKFYDENQSLWSGSTRTSLHNGYISVLIGVGIIAFFLWCIILIIPFLYSFKLSRNIYKAFFISVMSAILITNFTETAIQAGNSIDSMFFWVTWIMAGKSKKMKELRSGKNING